MLPVKKRISMSYNEMRYIGQKHYNDTGFCACVAVASAAQVRFGKARSVLMNKELHGELGGYDELICSCFKTTRKAITAAIEQGSVDLAALASTLGCGSKCGSCRPELNELLRLHTQKSLVA